MSQQDHITRIARQHAETSRLLGVDFLPRSSRSVVLPDEQAENGASESPKAGGDRASQRSSGGIDKKKALNELRKVHEAECPHCTKATAHTNLVWGDGDPDARR